MANPAQRRAVSERDRGGFSVGCNLYNKLSVWFVHRRKKNMPTGRGVPVGTIF